MGSNRQRLDTTAASGAAPRTGRTVLSLGLAIAITVPAIALRVAARQNPVRVWGSGLQGRDFVHIDDCVEACVRACRRISDGSAVNIGTGELVSFRELAALMVELEYFVNCIQRDRTPFNDGNAGLRVVKLLEAADQSLKERGRIVCV